MAMGISMSFTMLISLLFIPAAYGMWLFEEQGHLRLTSAELLGLQILCGMLCTLFMVPMHTLTAYLMGIKRALNHFNPQSGNTIALLSHTLLTIPMTICYDER
jgi:hypothetical protein